MKHGSIASSTRYRRPLLKKCKMSTCANVVRSRRAAAALEVQPHCHEVARAAAILCQNASLNGCLCKESWSFLGDHCSTYCCNPDSDPGGKWCFVEDQMCEGGEGESSSLLSYVRDVRTPSRVLRVRL
eukprot:s1838_g2.t1